MFYEWIDFDKEIQLVSEWYHILISRKTFYKNDTDIEKQNKLTCNFVKQYIGYTLVVLNPMLIKLKKKGKPKSHTHKYMFEN